MAGDGSSEFALDGKNVGQFAVVGFSPNVCLVVDPNELGGDAHTVVFGTGAALQHVVDPEFGAGGRDPKENGPLLKTFIAGLNISF